MEATVAEWIRPEPVTQARPSVNQERVKGDGSPFVRWMSTLRPTSSVALDMLAMAGQELRRSVLFLAQAAAAGEAGTGHMKGEEGEEQDDPR